jgi:CBS domain-containing protein
MRPLVVTAAPNESLASVADRMRAAGVGAAAVLEGLELAGILTERDLVRAMTNGSAGEPRVAEYMTPEPCTVAPGADARDAAGIMAERGFRHLPVVEEGRVIGFISARNLLELERRGSPAQEPFSGEPW